MGKIFCVTIQISIHAPTRGATQTDFLCLDTKENFNPRSHKGSDDGLFSQVLSIRQFQSTLPQGERPYDPFSGVDHPGISIHAPTRGATLCFNACCRLDPDFNPRSHKGSDALKPVPGPVPGHFNPRSHKGSDLDQQHLCICVHNFNPRSHKGSDVAGQTIDKLKGISIHAPTRGATAILHKIPYLFYFIFTNPFPISYFHTQPASDF